MNLRFLSKIIGTVLCAAAVCMLPSLLLSLAEQDGFTPAFLISIAAGAAVGYPSGSPPMATNDRRIYGTASAIVAGCWLCLSFFCALPYWLGGALPNFADALFETASGLTTTGASVIRDVEALPKSILFWAQPDPVPRRYGNPCADAGPFAPPWHRQRVFDESRKSRPDQK